MSANSHYKYHKFQYTPSHKQACSVSPILASHQRRERRTGKARPGWGRGRSPMEDFVVARLLQHHSTQALDPAADGGGFAVHQEQVHRVRLGVLREFVANQAIPPVVQLGPAVQPARPQTLAQHKIFRLTHSHSSFVGYPNRKFIVLRLHITRLFLHIRTRPRLQRLNRSR